MKKCVKCNAAMQDDDVFCGVCGTKYQDGEQQKDSLFLKYAGYLDNDSIYNVALAKEQGIMKSAFPNEAEEMYSMLAIRGHSDSMFRYAMLLLGKEEPDTELALSWLKKAAADGHVPSRNYLDVNFKTGKESDTRIHNTVSGGSADSGDNAYGNKGSQAVLSGAEVFAKLKDSVVEILAHTKKGVSCASGFVVSTTGFVITNAHAVLDANREIYGEISAKQGDKMYKCHVLAVGSPADGKNDTLDIALLYVPELHAASHVQLGDSSTCCNGQKVYLIGNSLGAGTCITSGIVSDATRKVRGLSYPYIMTDAAANHGNSGGPFLNEYGEVIGVLVSGVENAEGMNYAIPINIVKEFLGYVISETKDRVSPSCFGELTELTNEATNMKFQLSHIFTGIKLAADVIALILSIFI